MEQDKNIKLLHYYTSELELYSRAPALDAVDVRRCGRYMHAVYELIAKDRSIISDAQYKSLQDVCRAIVGKPSKYSTNVKKKNRKRYTDKWLVILAGLISAVYAVLLADIFFVFAGIDTCIMGVVWTVICGLAFLLLAVLFEGFVRVD